MSYKYLVIFSVTRQNEAEKSLGLQPHIHHHWKDDIELSHEITGLNHVTHIEATLKERYGVLSVSVSNIMRYPI